MSEREPSPYLAVHSSSRPQDGRYGNFRGSEQCRSAQQDTGKVHVHSSGVIHNSHARNHIGLKLPILSLILILIFHEVSVSLVFKIGVVVGYKTIKVGISAFSCIIIDAR